MKMAKKYQAYFALIAFLQKADTSDRLTFEEHTFLPKATCVTHSVTKRAMTVLLDGDECVVDYLADGKVNKFVVEDHQLDSWMVLAYLAGTYDKIG